eukprot:g3053.t1
MSVVSPGRRRGVARCLLRPGAIFPVSGLTVTLLFAATNTTNLTSSAFKIAPLGVSESDWNAGKPDFPTSVGAIYKHLHGSAGADNDAEKSRVAAPPTTTAAPLLNGDGLPFDTPEADLKAVEEQKGTLQASKAEKTAAKGAAAEAEKQLAAQQADATQAAKKAAAAREEVETATAAQQTEEYTASEKTGTLKAASEDVDAAEEALKTAQAAEREAETELDLALEKLAAAKAFTGSEQQKLDALERKERAETEELVDWEARLQAAREALARAQEAEAQAVEDLEALKLEIVEKIHEKNDPGGGERWSGLFSRQVLYGAVVVVLVAAGAAAVYFFGAGAWTMVMGPRAGA